MLKFPKIDPSTGLKELIEFPDPNHSEPFEHPCWFVFISSLFNISDMLFFILLFIEFNKLNQICNVCFLN